MDNRTLEILGNKPELVDEFPDWMLPASRIERLRKTEALAIAEIAGRDSIAAVLKGCDTGVFKAILPTIAYTGTEFGDWKLPFENTSLLRSSLVKKGIEIFDPVLIGSPESWWRLCGRYVTGQVRKYGFYSPCIGCHVYLHSIRIPIAKKVGSKIVISGERESHDGMVKINQIGVALDAYAKLLKEYEIELLYPLRYIVSGDEIQEILGPTWPESNRQMDCVLSKNYLNGDGIVDFSRDAIVEFLEETALPAAEEFINKFI